MKKTISLLLVLAIITACFSGCVNKSIELTLDNAEQYLNVDLNGGGTDYSYDFGYQSLYFSGEISGIDGYTYENVVIEITCYYDVSAFYSTPEELTITQSQTLNIAGNCAMSAKENTLEEWNEQTNDNKYVGIFNTVECKGYKITSISGTVTPN